MNSKRPRLKMPLTRLEKSLEIVDILIIVGVCMFIWLIYYRLPDRIPTHFGFLGTPDEWGSKECLLVFPGIMVIVYSVLTLLSRFPHIFNYLCEINDNNALFQYLNGRILLAFVKWEIILFFAYINLCTVRIAKGTAFGLGVGFLPIFFVVILGTLVYFVLRMIRNK